MVREKMKKNIITTKDRVSSNLSFQPRRCNDANFLYTFPYISIIYLPILYQPDSKFQKYEVEIQYY